MENFMFALNATMPVFLVILLGKILMKLGIINDTWTKITDKFAFRVALPVTLFLDIADMRADQGNNLKLVIFCVVVITIMFSLTWGFSYIFLRDKRSVGAFTQGSMRGSAAILGIPFAVNIYGNAGMVPLMILAAVPLFNAYSVIVLAISSNFRNKGIDIDDIENVKGVKISPIKVIKSIITNPLIVGIALGFPFMLFNIKIPFILHQSLLQVGNSATALMLISLGACFQLKDLRSRFKYSFIATILKLIVLPLVFIPFAVKIGFRNDALIAILIMLGAPSAISGYVMAKSMNNDYILMSNTIVMTTLFSAVTFTLWIFIFKSFSLI